MTDVANLAIAGSIMGLVVGLLRIMETLVRRWTGRAGAASNTRPTDWERQIVEHQREMTLAFERMTRDAAYERRALLEGQKRIEDDIKMLTRGEISHAV